MSELDPEKTKALDKIASMVIERDVTMMAIITLESLRPLSFLGSQMLLFFEPFLQMMADPQKIKLFQEAMEDRRYVDYLISKIEEGEKK